MKRQLSSEIEKAGYNYEKGRIAAQEEHKEERRKNVKDKTKKHAKQLLKGTMFTIAGLLAILIVAIIIQNIWLCLEDSKSYDIGSSADIAARYESGKYCTNGEKLTNFYQGRACVDIPEITDYVCTSEYCAVIYENLGDRKTYVIFEKYNTRNESLFKEKYNKPMTVYGNIAPFKGGAVAVRAYEDSQIQKRIVRNDISIRCEEFYGRQTEKCNYFK